MIAMVLAAGVFLAARSNKSDTRPLALSIKQPSAEEPVLSGAITMAYNDKGFEKPELKIRNGSSVKFINQRTEPGRPMWVASDAHPDHTVYPEFDQARPLGYEPEPKDDTYTFVFNKSGRWTYHDHYDPQMTGVIVVE